MLITNPRQAAFQILHRIDKERSYADILLDQELSLGAIKGPDRGLLTELVYGTLRKQGTIDHLIRQFSTVRIDRIERSVHILLRLGIYQMIFLDRIPVSAAVNETVKLAKIIAPKAAGFINAVLRETDRKRNSIVWPDKASDVAEWIAVCHSVPRWIAENWIVQIGEGDAEKLAISMSEAPPVTIRVNTLKCTRDELLLILSGEQITATPCKFSQVGIQILSHTPLTLLESFRSGYFSIQDEASQIAGILTGAETGDRVLDICAAPGGKTTCIAEMMGNTGEITAWDVNPRRLKQVQLLASRLGIQIINPAIMDAGKIFAPAVSKPYGKVLLDAPCSGLGVLRRNPEGKWWKTIEEIDALAEIQQRLLANAAEYVSPDGVLVYATCSTTARENEIVVDDFLSKNNEFVLENLQELYPQFAALCTDNGYFRSWPHLHGMDGFFAARLRRRK